MESGIAPQPVAQLLYEASRLRPRSTFHRVDGDRLATEGIAVEEIPRTTRKRSTTQSEVPGDG
jgi:hypothetical protein